MLDKAKDLIEKIAYIGRVITWVSDTLGAAIGSFPMPKKKETVPTRSIVRDGSEFPAN